MADRRVKTEMVVAAVGTVAASVFIAKAAKRIGEQYVDKTLKSGKIIQNIGAYENADFNNNPFYAAINKNDMKAYSNLYPVEKRNMEILKGNNNVSIYNNKIKLKNDIKVASVNNAKKIFSDKMTNDPEFKKNVLEALESTQYGFHDPTIKKYKETGKITSKVYDRFNQALATPEIQKAGLHRQFYNELKKNGYGAILDINDTRYSGYSNIAKSPTIFFDNNFDKISAKPISELEANKKAMTYVFKLSAKNTAKRLSVYALTGYTIRQMILDRKVSQYILDHPNTKLTEDEIIQLYE